MASLGIGVGSAYFANLTKYKPLFVLITGIMLYKSYSLIEKNNSSKKTKIIFWIFAIVSILIIYSPTILGLFN